MSDESSPSPLLLASGKIFQRRKKSQLHELKHSTLQEDEMDKGMQSWIESVSSKVRLWDRPKSPEPKDENCKVCCELEFNKLWITQRGNPKGPFRLRFTLENLKNAAKSGCTSCSVLLHGLKAFKYIADNPSTYDDSWSIRLQLAANTSLRLKVFAHGSQTSTGELEFYTPQTSTPFNAAFGPGGEIATSPYSSQCARLIQDWAEDCLRHHPRCQSSESSHLPSRVLNVTGTGRPRLESTYHDKKAPYIALSHCWGSFQPLTTTRATLDRRTESIEWSLLPKTFQDAISITRSMGIDYLWIDSLCIVQDDEDDWAQEAARMGEIFEGAYITLSATSAHDSTAGCFAPRKSTAPVVITDKDVPGLHGSAVHVRRHRGSEAHAWLTTASPSPQERQRAPTLSRGWCFQERLLASRVVHLAAEELVFECKSRCRCECGGAEHLSVKAMYLPLVSQAASAPASPEAQAVVSAAQTAAVMRDRLSVLALGLDKQRWRMLVEHYSTRRFTHLRDVLPALSALAQRYRGARERKDVYLAGIWRAQLPWDLLWYSKRSGDCSRPTEAEYRGGSMPDLLNSGGRIYTAPTFSWASRVGAVSWISAYDTSRVTVEVLAAKCFPKSSDPFGEVLDGFVRLRGPLISFSAKKNGHPLSSLLKIEGKNSGRLYLDTREGEGIAAKSPLQLLCVLKNEPNTLYHPIREATVLILRPSNARPGSYRRVGVIAWCDAAIFDDAPQAEVVIV